MSKENRQITTLFSIGLYILVNLGHIAIFLLFSWLFKFKVTYAALVISGAFANLHAFTLILLIVGLVKRSYKS